MRSRREAISLKGITYQRVKDYCDANGLSMSGFLEDLICENLDAARVPVPEAPKPRESTRLSKDAIERIAAEHFTF